MLVKELKDGCLVLSNICSWDDLSYFCVSMLPEASHQVSAQEDIWLEKRCWLKNSKVDV